MSTTKIKFESINANQKVSVKSYGYANPDATDYTLKTLVTGINAMSKNSVGKIYRINTTDITSATEGGDTPVVSGKSVSFTSSSNFFSGDASTFHTFLQAALNSETGNPQDEDAALSAMFMTKKVAAIDITYSEVKTLLNDNTATFQNIVDLLNTQVANSQASDLSLSFNASTQTLTLATSDTSDSATGSLNIMGSGTYFAEYILTDINSSTHTSTGSGDVTVSAEMLYLEIK